MSTNKQLFGGLWEIKTLSVYTSTHKHMKMFQFILNAPAFMTAIEAIKRETFPEQIKQF